MTGLISNNLMLFLTTLRTTGEVVKMDIKRIKRDTSPFGL